MTKNRSDDPAGRYAYEGLERVFHEKARLGIMTSLVTHPRGLPFADLKALCALTDGNLSRHLQVLHEAGFVEVCKGLRAEPAPDPLPAHRRRPDPIPRIHQRARKRRHRRARRPPRRPLARQVPLGRMVPGVTTRRRASQRKAQARFIVRSGP